MNIYSKKNLYEIELELIDRIRYLVGEGVELETVLKLEERKLNNQLKRREK